MAERDAPDFAALGVGLMKSVHHKEAFPEILTIEEARRRAAKKKATAQASQEPQGPSREGRTSLPRRQ